MAKSKADKTRDDVLLRMLQTPPQPHETSGKKRKSPKPNTIGNQPNRNRPPNPK